MPRQKFVKLYAGSSKLARFSSVCWHSPIIKSTLLVLQIKIFDFRKKRKCSNLRIGVSHFERRKTQMNYWDMGNCYEKNARVEFLCAPPGLGRVLGGVLGLSHTSWFWHFLREHIRMWIGVCKNTEISHAPISLLHLVRSLPLAVSLAAAAEGALTIEALPSVEQVMRRVPSATSRNNIVLWIHCRQQKLHKICDDLYERG